MSGELYVQYGCGLCAPTKWTNFDASPTLLFEKIPVVGKIFKKNSHRFPPNVRYGNVTRGLPISDSTCRGVYCSHVLEHLSYEDFDRAIGETFRILEPGGIFRLVVPDLEIAAREYLNSVQNGNCLSNVDFLRSTSLGVERKSLTPTAIMREWLGNSKHLWMWDYASLEAKLAQHGFKHLRRAQFNDSEDPAFRAVEDISRFERACALEARKPTLAAS